MPKAILLGRSIRIALSLAMACTTGVLTACRRAGPSLAEGGPLSTHERQVTFARDVAPILFAECSNCHRPGGPAPFSLLTYGDARRHAQQIVDVTQRRLMPPWPPERGQQEQVHVKFVGERVLDEWQIDTIRRWVDGGGVEGDPSHLPPAPQWRDAWHLGTPDLVLSMPRAYELPAAVPLPSGRIDVYRNFVIPTGLAEPRWVKAIQLRPEPDRVVHHAIVLVDPSRSLGRLEQPDDQPGFEGMELGSAHSPGPHFLSWQPGRLPQPPTDQSAWRLDPGTNLVLQLHLQPSGKHEQIQAKIGLYFTERPPPNYLHKICLRSLDINIPAGQKDYRLISEFQLPVDAEVSAVLPHAHYLGKCLEGVAVLPDGTTKTLIRIPDWDFNWQSDYQYKEPIALPAGTVIKQQYTYDNSADNVRNPHQPPRPVTYGPQSTDEMGELWLQLRLKNHDDLTRLRVAYGQYVTQTVVNYSQAVLRKNPDDGKAHFDLGKAMLLAGKPEEAMRHLVHATRANPDAAEGYYYLALALMRQRQRDDALRQFRKALEIDADHFESHHGLGLLFLESGDARTAEVHFRKALTISPYDPVALANLGRALMRQGRPAEARDCFQRSLDVRPEHEPTRQLLEQITR
jgi:Flp pilus assembly protein TadD